MSLSETSKPVTPNQPLSETSEPVTPNQPQRFSNSEPVTPNQSLTQTTEPVTPNQPQFADNSSSTMHQQSIGDMRSCSGKMGKNLVQITENGPDMRVTALHNGSQEETIVEFRGIRMVLK